LSRIRRIVGLGGSPAARLALRRCAAGKNIRHAVGSLLRQSHFGWLADTRMPTAPNAFAIDPAMRRRLPISRDIKIVRVRARRPPSPSQSNPGIVAGRYRAKCKTVEYVGVLETQFSKSEKRFQRAVFVGTGFMIIPRPALERLIVAYPKRKFFSIGEL
jgi:hypothetical protein